MLKNHFKIAWRSLFKNKTSSFINIAGLAVGMAVAILIGAWVWDELSFDHYHRNYPSIAQVMENQHLQHGIQTQAVKPIPLADALRVRFGSDLTSVSAASFSEQPLTIGDKTVTKMGAYVEPSFPALFTLKMITGDRESLKDPSSLLISRSLAITLFGTTDALNKMVKTGEESTLKVSGVYEDLPANTTFKDVTFLAPMDLPGAKWDRNDWYSSGSNIYVQLNPHCDIATVSSKIKDVLYQNNKDASKPALFLYPMSRWHLYSEFRNGVIEGGRIQFVWLFSIIGIFVLLLACINFMNLSTARSEKRAKEVGIRKTIGSLRSQLILQFFSESFLVVIFAFILALGLVILLLPFFNEVAGKQMDLPWTNPVFWIACLGFCGLTGFVAGSYPAFYLSSFRPMAVLKGAFKAGRYAAVPRKILVIIQFTVSIILIIGTIVVFRQIQFARNRPVGYSRDGLLTVTLNTDLQNHYPTLKNELLRSGAVTNMSESSSPTTGIWSAANNLSWKGKDPNLQSSFGTISASADFGSTIGWTIKEGRDFSSQFRTDSLAFIFNVAAIDQMGLKDPIGETVKWHGKNFTIIGIVENMVMTSPFDPAQPTVFMMNNERGLNVINLRLNPEISAEEAISRISPVFQKYNPTIPFDYKFADQQYAQKFASEERIGKLAAFFAALAIFISCLGLFGMASFVAEQRVKEIGVRKVLGASVLSLWSLLSHDFAVLVITAFLIAGPVAYYLMYNWLQHYQYKAGISWWVFAATGIGTLLITLLTVSFQTVRAAMENPVESLKQE